MSSAIEPLSTDRLLRWSSGRGLIVLRYALFVTFAASAVLLNCESVAVPATTWMGIYSPSDFRTFREAWEYVVNLRVPIPVAVSLTEILSCRLFGTTWPVTTLAYQVSLAGAFLLAMLLAGKGFGRLVACYFFSFVCVWTVSLTHYGNPQVYDVLFPFWILVSVGLLTALPRFKRRPAWVYVLGVGVGFAFAMAELTRPFVIFVLPVLLVGAYLAARDVSRGAFAAMLVPIVLLSGTWHVHQLVRHGQVTWSNHAGYNLLRAWPMVPVPALENEERDRPPNSRRGAEMNSATHQANSRRIQRAVLAYVAQYPFRSMTHAARRTGCLLCGKTDLNLSRPRHPVFWFYRPFVWLAAAWMMVQAIRLLAGFCRHGLRPLAHPENLLLVVTGFSVACLAVGDAGEEARFLLSLVPLLAVFPMYVPPSRVKPNGLAMSKASTPTSAPPGCGSDLGDFPHPPALPSG